MQPLKGKQEKNCVPGQVTTATKSGETYEYHGEPVFAPVEPIMQGPVLVAE
jgi:hypothetical protein